MQAELCYRAAAATTTLPGSAARFSAGFVVRMLRQGPLGFYCLITDRIPAIQTDGAVKRH